MKVILVNGSPHEKGCTYTALCEVAKTLEADGAETEIFWLGTKAISGCRGCAACRTLKKCVIDDIVNEFAQKAATADGFVFGSPVHYAAPSGAITAFMDRAFYSCGQNLRYKPAAAIVSCRRAGSSAALDVLNKYFTISCMPVVSSSYWNMVHGAKPEDVLLDDEGMQTMRTLGHNMAWILKCLAAGASAGVELVKEKKVYTNFIR